MRSIWYLKGACKQQQPHAVYHCQLLHRPQPTAGTLHELTPKPLKGKPEQNTQHVSLNKPTIQSVRLGRNGRAAVRARRPEARSRINSRLDDGPRTPHPKGVPGMYSRRRIHAGVETRSQAQSLARRRVGLAADRRNFFHDGRPETACARPAAGLSQLADAGLSRGASQCGRPAIPDGSAQASKVN